MLLKESLHPKQELSRDKILLLKIKGDENILTNKIIHFISYRARSKNEIMTRFRLKGYDSNSIQNSVNKLESSGFVNDKSFAKIFINHLVQEKKLGRKAVYFKMIPHKIDKAIMESILDEAYEENPPEVLLQSHIEKFTKGKKISAKDRKRLYNLLMRKGFLYSDFEPFVKKIESE